MRFCNFTRSINGNICIRLSLTCVDISSPSKWDYLLKVSTVCLLLWVVFKIEIQLPHCFVVNPKSNTPPPTRTTTPLRFLSGTFLSKFPKYFILEPDIHIWLTMDDFLSIVITNLVYWRKGRVRWLTSSEHSWNRFFSINSIDLGFDNIHFYFIKW